jgi:preprotein translocase subunit SecF
VEDAGAYLFLLILFGVLFGLPIWLMVRHHKKSQTKLNKLKHEQAKETPAQAEARKRDHNKHILTVICGVAGILLGSKLLGNVALGLVMGIVFGLVASIIADQIWKAE